MTRSVLWALVAEPLEPTGPTPESPPLPAPRTALPLVDLLGIVLVNAELGGLGKPMAWPVRLICRNRCPRFRVRLVVPAMTLVSRTCESAGWLSSPQRSCWQTFPPARLRQLGAERRVDRPAVSDLCLRLNMRSRHACLRVIVSVLCLTI